MAIDRRGATQKPKQKKQTKPKKVNQKPKKAEPKLPSYQPKAKTPTQIKPKKEQKKEVKKQYESYKASTFAPKVSNTSDKSAKEQAQIGYNAYQENKAKQEKKNVVTTQKPATSNKISDQFKVSDKEYKKAAKKGQKTTYLGTKQKDVTVDLATKKEKQKEKKQTRTDYYKSDDWKATKTELKKQNRKGWRTYLKDELGWTDEQVKEWMSSDQGKEYRKGTYQEAKDSLKKDINKQISKDVEKRNTLKSVNALTKGEFEKMETASRLGKDLGNKYLDSVDKKLAKKIGSKTVEAGLRSKGAYGVMQGMSKADIWSGSVGKYNEGAKTGIEKVKDSGAYNVGYGVGMAADMMMGGVASRGVSVAEGVGKAGAKAIGKAGAKGVGKSVAKVGGKDAGELARLSAKEGVPQKVVEEATKEYSKLQNVGRFAKNRAGELVAETPTNILDAAKMSMDADGNLDKKAFRTWLAVNSGLTFGVGGAIEGIGAATTKELGKDTISLLAKSQAGTLTKDEAKTLEKNIAKLKGKIGNNALSGNVASNVTNDIEKSIKDNRLQKKLAKANARSVTAPEVKAETKGAMGKSGGKVPKVDNLNVSPETKAKVQNLQKNVEKVDKQIAELETRKSAAKTPELSAQIDAEISIAKTTKREIVQNQKDLINPPKEPKPKKGYKEHRIGVETRRHLRNSAEGTTEKDIRDGLTELADDIKKGKPAQEIKAKATDLVMATRKIEESYDEVIPEQSLVEEHRAIKRVLRETPINISQFKGSVKQIRENLNLGNPGRRMRLVKSGGISIEEAFNKCLELQGKTGAGALEGVETNTILKNVDTEEEMLQELCRVAQEDKNQYLAVYRHDLSGEDILDQIEEATREYIESARKIAVAKPEPTTPLAKAEEQLRIAQREYKELDGSGAAAYSNLENAKATGEYVDEFQELYNQVQRQKFAVAKKINDLEAEVRKLRQAEWNKGKTPTPSEAEVKVWKEMGIAEDWVSGTGNKVADENIEKVMKESTEGLDVANIPKGKVDEDGVLRAETNLNKNIIYRRVREAIVDNFDALEHIANHLPEAQRKKLLAQINELRRSQKTGRAVVAEKGRKIYANAGLTKKGKDIEIKRNEFEEYCYLLHDLDRKANATDFLNMDRSQIRARLQELELKYAPKTKDGVLLDKENPIKVFQKEMVDYFNDLLDREVDAGITSVEEAANFKRMYPNYVPTYRAKEFDEILKKRTRDEIDVGRGIKAAKGGADDPLVPLYNQMQVKTNVVLKRTELNKTLNLLCTASGVTEKQLDALLPFFKQMPDEEKPMALLDTQVFTRAEGDKHIAVMYRNGEPMEISIDKDVFDAIRRWNGDDRKWVTLSAIVDNRVFNALNSAFKRYITDYSLIFGLKNFKRDTATALFYTTDIKGYIKNFPKAMAVCCLPDTFLSDSMRIYKEAMQVYKENGGIISQFVSRDSAAPTFFDSARKFNLLKYVEDFNSTLETIPRMSEFISAIDSKAIKLAGKDGNYDEAFRKVLQNQDDIADAMYRAKDVTLNFDRSGWFGARLNRGAVPFFNPAIQGLDKLGRKIGRDNIKYGADGKLNVASADGVKSFFQDTTVGSFMKFGAALGGMVGVPAIVWNEMSIQAEDGKKYKLQDFINGEVPGYEKQTDYNRYTHYLFPVGDGKFLKIPRARELASIQAVIDFGMDSMKYGSGTTWEKLFGEKAFRDWKSMLNISREQIGPLDPINDSLFTPIWNTYRNRTWYGGKIETGDDLTHREEGERYKIWDEKTSGFAKWVGKKFNISPKKVDNILDSYTGVVYDFGISQFTAKNDLGDRFAKEGVGSGIRTMLSSPFSQGFIIDSVFSNANKTDYYNYVDKREEKLAKLKEGSDEYNKLFAEQTKDKNAFGYTSSQYDELISQIYLDKNLTPTEKNYYARLLKKGDNAIWNDRKDGRVTSSRDPMADAWNLTDSKGKRVLSTKTIIDSCSFTYKNGTNTIKDAYATYKKNGGSSDEKFMKVTLATRDVNRAAGESLSSPRWEVVAYANQLNGIKNSDKVISAYIEKDSTRNRLMNNAKQYADYGFTLKNYKTTRKTVVQGAYDLGYEYVKDMRDGELTMVIANARTQKGKKYRDGSYQANDFYIMQRMNSARCLDHKRNGGYTAKQIKDLCDKYKLNPKDDYSWDLEKVQRAINKDYGDASNEVKAAMLQVITGITYKNNPFGSIGDYSLSTDTGVTCGNFNGGGYGWHRHRWHRGGGGGRKTPYTGKINKAGAKAKVTDTSKKNTSAKSNLDDAYRKKLKKLREETRK